MLIPPMGLSLPVITDVRDCADFSKTVLPYLVQYWDSPDKFNLPLGDPEALKHLYLTTNPVLTGLLFTLATWPIFLIVSEVNRNWSQVDRVWSILPTIFNAHFAIWAHMNGMPTARVDNVLAFSVLWSVRLTFNYWRRGGYQIGSEDYRWMIIKDRIGSFAFFLLNIVFTSTLQVLFLFAVTTPTYVLLLTSRISAPMTTIDTIFARSFILLVVVEYFADGQQWSYQTAKKSYQTTAKVPQGYTRAQMDRGFNTTGLWRFSRHPNFLAEQTIWLTLYIWGAWASNTWLNWTVLGAVTYLGVFQGSTPITEAVTAGKYPEYKLYKARVGRFVPALGKGWDEAEMAREAPKLLQDAKKKDGKR